MNLYHTHDIALTTLPDHLRYRAPHVPNSFAHVESRYRNAPSPKRQHEAPEQRAATPNPRYSGVTSRFRSPVKQQPQPPPPEIVRRTESVKMTPEYEHHKRVAAAAGFGNANSKYFESYHQAAAQGQTPRARVQETLRTAGEKKDGIAFKAWSTQAKTFSDMAHENPQMQLWDAPASKSRGRTSVVMNFVNNGIPIPSSRPVSPARKPSPTRYIGGRPYTGAGGAGGGSFERKPNSPVKQVQRLEDAKVRTLVTTMASARTRSPPRAANVPTVAISSKYSATPSMATDASYSRQSSRTSVNLSSRSAGKSPSTARHLTLHTDAPAASNEPVAADNIVTFSVPPRGSHAASTSVLAFRCPVL
jgi:hypothetical protein